MRPRIVAMTVAFALVASACTTASEPVDDGETTVATTGDGAVVSDPDVSDAAADVPALPVLWTTSEFAEPGEAVEIRADARLSGTIALVGPDGDLASAPLEDGTASLTLPATLDPGSHGLRLGEDDAFGSVMVVGSPGLVIRGTSYGRPDEPATVEAIVHGLAGDTVAALETRAPDGTIERLAPHPLLGLAPMPITGDTTGLSEGRHRLTLPAGFEGSVRLVAGSPDDIADPYAETPPSISSTELRISSCDTPSAVTGAFTQGGVITSQSIAGTARVATDDGEFTIVVEPGWNLVSAILDDGTSPAGSPQLIRVGCGETLELGDLETEVDTGPAPGDYLGGLTSDDLWSYTATATGDLAFQHEGFADCSVSNGALEITLGTSSADPWLYTLTLDPPLESGRRQGNLELMDIFSDDSATGVLDGEIEVGRVDELDAIGGSFAGTISGELGTSEMEIQFTCAVFSLTGAGPAPRGAALPSGRFAAASPPIDLLAQVGGGSKKEVCRDLFIYADAGDVAADILLDRYAAGLEASVQRLGVLTASDVRFAFLHMAQRELIGTHVEDSPELDIGRRAVNSDFLLWVKGTPAGERWFITATLYDQDKARRLASIEASGATEEEAFNAIKTRWSEFVDPLITAAICAEVAPTSAVIDAGATQEYTVEATDLAGEPPRSGRVTEIISKCGTWAPPSGALDETTWTTKFTAGDQACAEEALIVVRADGTIGPVRAEAETSITVETLWQFSARVTFDDGANHLVAESSGEFFIDEDTDAFIGAGTGYATGEGEARCEVNGAVTLQPSTIVGTYDVMVIGGVRERPPGGGWGVTFSPTGFNIRSEVTYATSSPCYDAGTYTNDFLGYLAIGALVSMPHWLAYRPDGFSTYLNPDGSGVVHEETLEGLPGARIRLNLWRPQP